LTLRVSGFAPRHLNRYVATKCERQYFQAMRFLITSLLYLLFCSVTFGQISDKVSFLNVQANSRTAKFARYNAVVPESLSDNFFDFRVFAVREQATLNDGNLLSSIFRKTKIFSVSRDVLNIKSPRKNRDGSVTFTMVSHPAFFPAVIAGRNIYVFSRDDEKGSVDVFNQLTKNLQIKVANADEAQQLTDLYLFLYSIKFKKPSEIIVSRLEDIPEKYRIERPERAEKAKGVIQPLKTVEQNGKYKVEFFTWENFPRGEVLKWQFEVSEAGEISLNQELLVLI
jgi:hypothetical protein